MYFTMLNLLKQVIPNSKMFSISNASSLSRHEPPVTFHQFMSLPVELRLKIWEFAIEPRIHRVHYRTYSHESPGDEEAEESEEDGEENEEELEEHDAADTVEATETESDTGDGLGEIYGYGPDGSPVHRPCNMVITPCNPARCNCSFFPPESHGALPLPAAVYACSESRAVGLPRYSTYIEQEYDTRGLPVIQRHSRLKIPKNSVFPTTGLMMDPLIDILLVPVNVASATSVRELHHFAAVVARQIPDLRKVIIDLTIFMAPYRFWSSARFQYWRNWGLETWWIPIKLLVRMKGLREVVLIRRADDKMLPDAWKDRITGQWEDEFLKAKERWPVEWEGTAPSIRFVSKLKHA